MPEWFINFLCTIIGLAFGGFGLKYYEKHLRRKIEHLEMNNLVIEQKINVNALSEQHITALKVQVEDQTKEVNELNRVIAAMAVQKIKDDRKNLEKMAEMDKKINDLVIQNGRHIDRELKCLERLGELSKKFNL